MLEHHALVKSPLAQRHWPQGFSAIQCGARYQKRHALNAVFSRQAKDL